MAALLDPVHIISKARSSPVAVKDSDGARPKGVERSPVGSGSHARRTLTSWVAFLVYPQRAFRTRTAHTSDRALCEKQFDHKRTTILNRGFWANGPPNLLARKHN